MINLLCMMTTYIMTSIHLINHLECGSIMLFSYMFKSMLFADLLKYSDTKLHSVTDLSTEKLNY